MTALAVLSTTSMQAALGELAPGFGAVRSTFCPGSALAAGIPPEYDADLLVGPVDLTDSLTERGQIVAGSRVDLVRSHAAVAVRAGDERPEIDTVDAFRRALVAARSIGVSRGPSGVQFLALADRLGVGAAVRAKAVVARAGEPVGALVASGAAALGVQQLSELLPVAGIDILGPLPDELREAIVYAVSRIASREPHAEAAAFIAFLRSPASATVLRRRGFDPI